MQEKHIHGRCAEAIVYTVDNADVAVDDYALAQIRHLCDMEVVSGNTIRVMPDVHPGKGCVIGLTMTLASEAVMPHLVGVDIGCGVSVSRLDRFAPAFRKLDKLLADKVPSGFGIHAKPQAFEGLETLCCARHVQLDRARKSLGTLGGGNHFCEVASDDMGQHYLVIHTGSRHLGKEVCEWYLSQGRRQGVPYEDTWLEGDLREQYLHDMQIVQDFATANRQRIAAVITKGMKWGVADAWESVHNFIDTSGNIPLLRKGAISAAAGERVIIPSNMREGSILGVGKGNAAWNWSAPHGTGRVSSRAQTREQGTLTAFRKSMEGIWCTCISRETLDEAPFAYRAQADMREALRETVDVQTVVRPVYNFKAGGKS